MNKELTLDRGTMITVAFQRERILLFCDGRITDFETHAIKFDNVTKLYEITSMVAIACSGFKLHDLEKRIQQLARQHNHWYIEDVVLDARQAVVELWNFKVTVHGAANLKEAAIFIIVAGVNKEGDCGIFSIHKQEDHSFRVDQVSMSSELSLHTVCYVDKAREIVDRNYRELQNANTGEPTDQQLSEIFRMSMEEVNRIDDTIGGEIFRLKIDKQGVSELYHPK